MFVLVIVWSVGFLQLSSFWRCWVILGTCNNATLKTIVKVNECAAYHTFITSISHYFHSTDKFTYSRQKKKLDKKIFQIEETLSHKYDKSYKRNVFVNRSITLYQHSLTLFSSQIYQSDTDGRENKRKAKVKNFKCCYVQACRHL